MWQGKPRQLKIHRIKSALVEVFEAGLLWRNAMLLGWRSLLKEVKRSGEYF
ncbi:hypothetical protein IFO70_00660 [Phormidium tenue FACHB-886]|nr:hypothetical protein [Phormidium tenue FACHB-886]